MQRSNSRRPYLKATTAAVALAGLSALPARAADEPTAVAAQNLGDVNSADLHAGI